MTTIYEQPKYCSICGGTLLLTTELAPKKNVFSGNDVVILECERNKEHDTWFTNPYEIEEESWTLESNGWQ